MFVREQVVAEWFSLVTLLGPQIHPSTKAQVHRSFVRPRWASSPSRPRRELCWILRQHRTGSIMDEAYKRMEHLASRQIEHSIPQSFFIACHAEAASTPTTPSCHQNIELIVLFFQLSISNLQLQRFLAISFFHNLSFEEDDTASPLRTTSIGREPLLHLFTYFLVRKYQLGFFGPPFRAWPPSLIRKLFPQPWTDVGH